MEDGAYFTNKQRGIDNMWVTRSQAPSLGIPKDLFEQKVAAYKAEQAQKQSEFDKETQMQIARDKAYISAGVKAAPSTSIDSKKPTDYLSSAKSTITQQMPDLGTSLNKYKKQEEKTQTGFNPKMEEPKKEKRGIIENVALGITSLPRKIAGGAEATARIIGHYTGIKPITGEEQLMALTPEEQQRMSDEGYIKSAGRTALEGASYMVPFGKGTNVLTKAILPGATVGAMQEVAQADKPTAGSIAKSAVVGGTLAGTLHGAGKIAEKMSSAGKSIRGTVLNPQAESTPFYTTEKKALQEAQEKIGLTGSSQSQLSQMPKKFQELQSEIKSVIKGAKPLKASDIIDDFNSALENSNYLEGDATYKAAKDVFTKRINGIFGKKGEVNPEALYDLKSKLTNELRPVMKKIDVGNPLTPKEEVRYALWNGIKTSLDKVSPKIRELNKLENQMFDMSKGLVKSAESETKIPLLNVRIPGAKNLLQNVADAGGRMLQQPKKIISVLPETSPTIKGQIASRFPGVITEGAGNSTNDQQYDKSLDNQFGNIHGKEYSTDTTQSQVINIGEQQYSLAQLQEARDNARLSGDKTSADQIDAVIQDNFPEQKTTKLTEKQGAFANASNAAQKALNLLESGNVETGFGQGVLGQIGERTGDLSKEQVAYRSSIALARTAARAAMLGANMSTQELESLDAAIPQYHDAPEIAKQKLKTFIELIGQFSKNSQNIEQPVSPQSSMPSLPNELKYSGIQQEMPPLASNYVKKNDQSLNVTIASPEQYGYSRVPAASMESAMTVVKTPEADQPTIDQNDYPDYYLGNTPYTVASVGCAASSVAMALNKPLEEIVNNTAGFDDEGYIHWDQFGDLIAREGENYTGNPVDLNEVANHIKNGDSVILETTIPGAGQHFVLGVGMRSDNRDVLIKDPYTGSDYWYSAIYGNPEDISQLLVYNK